MKAGWHVRQHEQPRIHKGLPQELKVQTWSPQTLDASLLVYQ